MIYTQDSYHAETDIISGIGRLKENSSIPSYVTSTKINKLLDEFERKNKFKLAKIQREAVNTVLLNPVSILTGGPGTGKTTTIKAILWVYEQLYDLPEEMKPLLLAPTGRAARRMYNQTEHEASTIHSSIGYINDEDGGEGFTTIDELKNMFIIVDESSMVDQQICASLFKTVCDEAQIVFVGDPDQLPSVGAGNVLMDMINSGVIPKIKLEVIYRQSENSPIIENAGKIMKGDTHLSFSKGFYLKESASEMNTLVDACSFYISCVNKFGIDNVALLTPLREKTTVNVKELNKQLQHRLNPLVKGQKTMKIHDITFRKGDRVMQLKNTTNTKNGDIGYIKDIVYAKDPHNEFAYTDVCVINFNDDEEDVVYNKDDMKNVNLAYACTVHKSQGSEYKTVIIAATMQHKVALRRNLIYTAITRATDNVAIIGSKEAIEYAISNDVTDVRYTLLKQRLIEKLSTTASTASITEKSSSRKEEEKAKYEQTKYEQIELTL